MMLRLTPIVVGACSVFIVSCDKITQVADEAKSSFQEVKEKYIDAPEELIPLSGEELAQSDLAVKEMIELMEEVPVILAKVRDEGSAFAARKQLENIGVQVEEAAQRAVPIEGEEGNQFLQISPKEKMSAEAKPEMKDGKKMKDAATPEKQMTPEIEGMIFWYVLGQNKADYEARSAEVGKQVGLQLRRLARISRGSSITLDVVMDGVTKLVDIDSKGGGDSPENTIKPMPAGWLPPGISRE